MPVPEEVKKMLIGHYSQRYKNLEALLAETKDLFPNVILSFPGLEIDFKEI